MRGRPTIEVVLTLVQGGQTVTRTLLADTGAGTAQAPFEMLLDETDCLLCGGKTSKSVSLGGAYSGTFPIYVIRVEIPLLNFKHNLFVVGVATPPIDLDGIAGFRFLNRFSYGNFADSGRFGLEM